MLVFKQKQVEVFNAIALKKYENDLIVHVKNFFPEFAAEHSDEEIRHTIKHAVAKGKMYGFVSRKNVCILLNIMLLHGLNFDYDDDCFWAKEILHDKTILSPDFRISELNKKSKKALRIKQTTDL
jgi:hypothetical protein